MRINTVNNNVNFTDLHIARTPANKMALERFSKTSPEILNQALTNFHLASGEEDIYLTMGLGNGSTEIPITISGKQDNILTLQRVNYTKKNEMQNGFRNILDSYVRTKGKIRPPKKVKNMSDDVKEILNKYA